MLTANDVKQVVFEKSMRGYRPESVDDFLDLVIKQIEEDAATIAKLKSEAEQFDKKLYLLAQKIEEYRADEDNLKSALLNAQRMGENVISEAKQKADSMLRDASVRAENLTRMAIEESHFQEAELERAKTEVSEFKANILNLYRQHIQSLSTLPENGEGEDETLIEDVVESAETAMAVEETPVAQEITTVENIFVSIEAETEQEPIAQENITEETAEILNVQESVPTFVENSNVTDTFENSSPVAEPEKLSAFFSPIEEQQETPTNQFKSASISDAFKGVKFSD